MTRHEIGRAIAVKRMELGMSQTELALQCGCVQSLVGAMELGKKAGIITILKAAEVLELELTIQ